MFSFNLQLITNLHTRIAVALFCMALTVGVSADASNADALRVVIPKSFSESSHDAGYYFKELLILAFEKTRATDGAYVIEEYPEWLGAQRMRAMIAAGKGMDLIWSTSNSQREEQLRAIPVNLLKGLNEHRILLIRAEDQRKFARVKSLDDLKKFTAGSGTHWQDTAIMKANGLPVETAWDIESLFKMLAAKRFDYISRGAHEIWEEVDTHKDLVAENRIILHYGSPTYFFVSHNNLRLADRLTRGLKLTQDDGSFDKLFLSIPAYTKGFMEITNSKRKIFELSEGVNAPDDK